MKIRASGVSEELRCDKLWNGGNNSNMNSSKSGHITVSSKPSNGSSHLEHEQGHLVTLRTYPGPLITSLTSSSTIHPLPHFPPAPWLHAVSQAFRPLYSLISLPRMLFLQISPWFTPSLLSMFTQILTFWCFTTMNPPFKILVPSNSQSPLL